MGNSQSSDTPKSPTNHSYYASAQSTPSSPFTDDSKTSAPSKQSGSYRKASAPVSKPSNPLTTSLVTSSGSASISTSSAHAHATVSISPQRSGHTRVRSITTSGARPEATSHNTRSDVAASVGSGDCKQRSSRSAPLPTAAASESPASLDSKVMTSPASRPVDVPQPSNFDGSADLERTDFATGYSESPYGLPPANYSRPPRLPLPIEEEVHTPGSPIITPQDIVSPLDANEVEGALPRKASVLSSTTVDEDEDVGDNDAFAAESSHSLQVRIPTRLEWNAPGDKIFVTGTFCNWEKKMKLHHNKERPGFSAYVLLPPGTHHIKFIVDGEMVTSNELPTTVDWTNILVNYIEIVAPLPPAPAEPIPIPGATATAGQAVATDEAASRPLSYETKGPAPVTDAELPTVLEEPAGAEIHQPSNQQPSPAPTPSIPGTPQRTPQPKPESKPNAAPAKPQIPRPKYTSEIPKFLEDLDNYNHPEDERFQRASKVVNHLPQPPSLPMFLSKSILNGATPHKDDASVLIMPNHTVLNHLATSSIKSGVLATSGTTRYKRKFLTTIFYKPTSDDG